MTIIMVPPAINRVAGVINVRPGSDFTYRATPQELADNDFNLNIPRYVDTPSRRKRKSTWPP